MTLDLTDEEEFTLKEVADELGVTPENLKETLEKNIARSESLRISPDSMYRVIGVDKFTSTDWLEEEYDTAQEAVAAARDMTRECMHCATDASVATVYYAYDPEGVYLGGDVWNEG